MTALRDTAFDFFDTCESGKGWEGVRQYCHEDATFSTEAKILKGIDTIQDYADWVQGMFVPMPDASYELRSFAVDEERQNALAFAVFIATHTGEGGPIPASGNRVEADFVYSIQFDGERIRHVTKIWHDGVTLDQLGWS